MNRDDIIRMALEAGLMLGSEQLPWGVERFAALVAAAVEERLKWDGLHSCHPECDRPACVNMRKAVEAEREACAKVCEEGIDVQHPIIKEHMMKAFEKSSLLAAAIRARGQE